VSEHFPVCNANQVVRVLRRNGFLLVSQKGSHQKWLMIINGWTGATRVIVFALLLAVVIAVAWVVAAASAAKRRAASLGCASRITSISLAVRLWAEDNGGVCASNFLCMSNELTPKILVCPGDRRRQKATDWASLTPANCSYEIMSPGLRVKDTNTAFIRCAIHGHLGYTDGTVFDGVRRRHKYE